MADPKKVTKSKVATDSQELIGDKANVETLVIDKSLATVESLVNADSLPEIVPSVTTTELVTDAALVNADKSSVIEPLVAATSLATGEPLATANPLATDDILKTNDIRDAFISESISGAGTTVPNEGSDVKISDQSTPQKKTIVIFLGPYQRYSRGDKAGFSADYAETLVARNIACWPKDFAAKSKGNSHGYDFAV
ncbi:MULTISPECIES: hypothetical protein [Yersinia]|uniref:hypothetical protein n=1 Tax=Yersinia TaxID=629 RepID=UPI0011A618DF|nr:MULTISPECIES: hypothetical protein [Yersinia]MDN0096179.1 hypothetical protein [Yersinia rohdei]